MILISVVDPFLEVAELLILIPGEGYLKLNMLWSVRQNTVQYPYPEGVLACTQCGFCLGGG